jgi:ribonuclease Y
MEPITAVLALALAVAAGALGLVLVRRGPAPSAAPSAQAGEAEARAARIVADAEREADVLRRAAELEIKDLRLSARAETEAHDEARKAELREAEKRLSGREDRLEAREAEHAAREQAVQAEAAALKSRAEAVQGEERRLLAELERVGGLSAEQAREEVKARIEEDARFESARMLQRLEEEAREKAEDSARHVICSAIQRIAGDYVVESTISVVSLPSDDMKGRIIGREGRNIRALEAATGVNLIVDDTPEAIVLSSFDPLRREVARLTLEKLLTDGRFHPSRIEETAAQVEQRLEKEMREEAGKVVFELDVHGLHPDVVGLLGRLKYRTSYGQNNLAHAREVALLCGMMADELGLDRALAVRGGLLHDIGKALTQEMDGGHAVIGAEFARKCGEDPVVVNAIEAHHGDVPPITKEAYLVAAGDALSAARPGARRENMERYVKRLAELEEVAGAFPGVDKVYALQAGREIRVMVDAESLSDEQCTLVSRDIAHKIEKELTYPGQIKVCLVRESRFIEYAR